MALPLSVSTPVPAFQLPVMPFWLVKASVSSAAAKPAETVMVALARFALSTSLRISALSTAVAAPFSVYARVLPVAVGTGASLTAVTVIATVSVSVIARSEAKVATSAAVSARL